MGPLAKDRRIPALESLIGDAVEQGAQLKTGGRRFGNEGWFFEPTVLADVPLSARIMSEEPFGPVAVVNRFGDLGEAITEANRLPYGLAAYAFTQSSATATRLGNEIEAGMLSINHLGLALPEVHFGGLKDSGHGTEGGSEALQAYLDTRLVTRKG
jgi:succinate-semialdehyde dehydrogenase/glutarate-semialdehyde dehydrogenase